MDNSAKIYARKKIKKSPVLFRPKPTMSEYGYCGMYQVLYPCSREELIKKVSSVNFLGTPVEFVWMPEVETLTEPHEVSELFEPLKRRLRKVAVLKIIGSLLIITALAILLHYYKYGLLFLFSLIILIPAFLLLWENAGILLSLKKLTFADLNSPPDTVDSKHLEYFESFKLTWTKEIAACVIAAGALQIFAGSGIQAAGLVKPSVRQGEVWRLVTAGLLHGSFYHFWVNFGSLMWLGKLIEAFTHRAYLPIVFCLSIIFGSLASLMFLPTKTSIGASGGLMGLIGFLVILGIRHKNILPPNFFQSLLLNIALVSLIGFIGSDFIDNAAHGGGLLCGLLIGWLLLPAQEQLVQVVPIPKNLILSQVFRFLIILTTFITGIAMHGKTIKGFLISSIVIGLSFLAVRKFTFFDNY